MKWCSCFVGKINCPVKISHDKITPNPEMTLLALGLYIVVRTEDTRDTPTLQVLHIYTEIG